MRVAGFETFPVALPFLEPYVTATGTLEQREMLLLRIESEDGVAGWGDAVPLSLRGGAPLEVVSRDLDRCGAVLGAGAIHLVDDAEQAFGAVLDACAGSGIATPALAALDMALLDLLGRTLGAPAWRLLGASERRILPCNGTLGAGAPEAVADAASRLAGAGFDTLKVKVGTGDDRERLRAVREAAGEAVRLRVDANGAWSPAQAATEIQAMDEEVGLELAEQPCADLDGLAELRGRVSVPLVADESIASRRDAEGAVASGACDAATIKLAKVGGTRQALRVGAVIPSYLSSALDSVLGIAAAAQTAQALPADGFVAELAHGLATSRLFADNVAPDADLRHSSIAMPAAPGLGVEIDETAVERLRIP